VGTFIRHRRGVSQPIAIPKEGEWSELITVLQSMSKEIDKLRDELDRVRRLAGIKPLMNK